LVSGAAAAGDGKAVAKDDGDAGPKQGGSKHRDLATAQNNLDDDSVCERSTKQQMVASVDL